MNKITSVLFFILWFCSCEEFTPEVKFKEPVKGRMINLSQKVGKSIQVLRNNDTISYSLTFNKSNHFNYIIQSDSDTIFEGTITKRKELFLLHRLLNDETYSIHALEFTDSTVTGLETEWYQSYILKKRIDSGGYANLIWHNPELSDDNNIPEIEVSKRDAKNIFRMVLDHIEPEKLISKQFNTKPVELKLNEASIHNPDTIFTEELKLIRKVFPNPFTDHITIELNRTSPFAFQVYNFNGELLKTSKLYTNNIKLNLSSLNKGKYILRVFDTEENQKEEITIIKR